MKVAEAAKRLGVSQQFVRVGLQRGVLPIGCAVKFKRWVYYINDNLLDAYITKNPPAATDGRSDSSGAERT